MPLPRTADPYRDADVIDARAPRFNQATIGLLGLVALATGWWPLLGILGFQLIVGLALGRRFCLPCVFYFEVVQPRVGEGEIEDSRPPRFANVVGAAFLSAATAAHVIGLETLGWTLGAIVAVLAMLAAITGLCVGCEIYRLWARVRGIRPGHVDRVDLTELGTGSSTGDHVVVQFTHPLCTGCRELTQRLESEGRRLMVVDISERRDLARKYNVAVVPTAFSVGSDGRVLERIA